MKLATGLRISSLFALLLAPLGAFAQSLTPAEPLTVEAIYSHGALVESLPDVAWSPDGKHLTYIDDGELMEIDPGAVWPRVLVDRDKMSTLDETGGTEQDRTRRARYHMASYFWAPDSRHLLFDSDGAIWYYSLKTGTGIELGDSGLASGDDPKFSPDGRSVSFVNGNGLAVIDMREPGTPTRVIAPTPDPSSGQDILNGAVDWVYEEELDTRGNYFWSPDSKAIAYLQMDETGVPRYPISDLISLHATVAMQRYPQPGDRNPAVRVGVVGAHGGKTGWMHVPLDAGNDYIPRFGWVDKKTLWIEVLTRDQKHRILYFANIYSGDARPMLEIDDAKFLRDDYDVTVDDGYIVLTAWTSGYNQIYLYSYDAERPMRAPAELVRQLTQGDFAVSDVYRVDVADKLIDYASNQGNPLEQQIWQVDFGGHSKQLSAAAGFHEADFSPDGTAFADTQSTRMEPARISLCASPGKCKIFWQPRSLHEYDLPAPRQLEVKAKDGTTLYATLLMPKSAAPHSVPLIVNPYGGPGAQGVANKWDNGLLFDEVLAEHGFAVLHADNRGMAGRGRAFAQFAYRDFGPVQLQDQLTVIDAALAQFPQLDPKRLGWWGWSWGGTFTLYALTRSDRFRAGVAVAPVANWRDYDSIYTERYLGLPSRNPAVYSSDSPVNFAENLHGHLLLAQGTADENVHMQNTWQFVNALTRAHRPYDLRIFPGKTHAIAGVDARTELYNRILEEFETYLAPPAK